MGIIPSEISLRKAAIITGAAIVMMMLAAMFATDITMVRLIVQDDATATIDNIQASEMLFRWGIFSWLGVWLLIKGLHVTMNNYQLNVEIENHD